MRLPARTCVARRSMGSSSASSASTFRPSFGSSIDVSTSGAPPWAEHRTVDRLDEVFPYGIDWLGNKLN